MKNFTVTLLKVLSLSQMKCVSAIRLQGYDDIIGPNAKPKTPTHSPHRILITDTTADSSAGGSESQSLVLGVDFAQEDIAQRYCNYPYLADLYEKFIAPLDQLNIADGQNPEQLYQFPKDLAAFFRLDDAEVANIVRMLDAPWPAGRDQIVVFWQPLRKSVREAILSERGLSDDAEMAADDDECAGTSGSSLVHGADTLINGLEYRSPSSNLMATRTVSPDGQTVTHKRTGLARLQGNLDQPTFGNWLEESTPLQGVNCFEFVMLSAWSQGLVTKDRIKWLMTPIDTKPLLGWEGTIQKPQGLTKTKVLRFAVFLQKYAKTHGTRHFTQNVLGNSVIGGIKESMEEFENENFRVAPTAATAPAGSIMMWGNGGEHVAISSGQMDQNGDLLILGLDGPTKLSGYQPFSKVYAKYADLPVYWAPAEEVLNGDFQ